MLNTQSPLTEPVIEADLLAIVRASFNHDTELVEHRQLTGGLFNTSYYLATQNPQREVIVRIAPSEVKHSAMFNYEKTMMQSEPVVYDIMHDNGLPVPDVIAMDATGTVISRQYILLDYLDTTPMNDPSVPDDVKSQLQQQLGAYLKQMHNITHEKFGRVQADGTVDGDTSWRIVFEKLFAEAVQRCREHDLIEDEILIQAEKALIKHASLLDDPEVRPALIHGDLWDANVLLTSDDDNQWQIEAIIDVDRAMFADAEFDACLWYNTPDFLIGYGTRQNQSEAAQIRHKLYHLYQDFFHLFVFAMQIPLQDRVKLHYDNAHNFLQML